MSETITIDAQVRVDDCEPIAKAWIKSNEVQAMDLFIESKLIRRLCNSLDEWTDDELEALDVALRAEQHRRDGAVLGFGGKLFKWSELLTTAQAAAICRLSPNTLDKMRMTVGRGPRFLKLGRRVFYRHQDLDDWINSNAHISTGETKK